jgi:hypothetical protein
MAGLIKEEEIKEMWELSREREKDYKEIKEGFKEIRELFKETDRRSKETDRQLKETDKQIKDLSRLFTGQWGKLIEALVEPGVKKLFVDRNIGVRETHRRIESVRNGSTMEVDLLLINDQDIVVIEVKTTLQVDDVRDFVVKLQNLLQFFPKYKSYNIYGAIAALQMEEGADRFAYKQGLFVLKAGKENMVEMLNDLKFKPKNFNRVVPF